MTAGSVDASGVGTNIVSWKFLMQNPQKIRVLLLYPWGDLRDNQSGASQRVNHLLDYLCQSKFDVRAIQDAGGDYFRADGTPVTGLLLPSVPLWIRLPIKALCRISRDDAIVELQFFKFFELFFAKKKAKYILTNLTNWADMIIVEYPFMVWWLRWRGVNPSRIIVTAHDTIYKQPKSRLIGYLVKILEISSYRNVHAVVVVSGEDRETLSSFGIDAHVSSHPVENRIVSKDQSRLDDINLSKLLGFDVVGKKVCLFVGSGYHPNVEAVEQIREISRICARSFQREDIIFLVAGGCSEPVRHGTFFAVGRVDVALLNQLYFRADLVLVPLLRGTGSSVKTIEAFSYGKPVLGTSIAFRGWHVSPGKNCILENCIKNYPARIIQILSDRSFGKRVGEEAAIFANEFSASVVFCAYARFLHLGMDLHDFADESNEIIKSAEE